MFKIRINIIIAMLACSLGIPLAGYSTSAECYQDMEIENLNSLNSEKSRTWFETGKTQKISREAKNALIAGGTGLVVGAVLGGATYLTYFPNEAMITNSAGRDFVSPISGLFSITKPLARTTVGIDADYGFYLTNTTLAGLPYQNLAQKYALGHMIDGAIIGAGVGIISYTSYSIYKYFINKNSKKTEELNQLI